VLPVGPGASALAVDLSNPPVTVAVANAGSNDVSVFTLARGPSVGPEVRVSAGAAPSALAFAELTRDGIGDIAVSDAGSGTVSVLAGDGHGSFAPGMAVALGGVPGAIAVAFVDRDPVPDLVVADASAPRLMTVLGARGTPVPGPSLALPDPSSRAAGLALGRLDSDSDPDLAVADRGTGTVRILHGKPRAGFRMATVAQAGVDPVGLFAGALGGDRQEDLGVADALTQTVRLLLTPGDRLLSPDAAASNLASGKGVLAWASQHAANDTRVVVSDGASTRELPVPGATRALVPHVGERTPGHAVVTYVRCRGRACRPYAWDVVSGRERAVSVPAPRGCRIEDVAVWDKRLAYVIGGCRARGLWLRTPGQRARRLAASAVIGALRGDRMAWKEYRDGGDSWRERLLSGRGRARTLDAGNLDGGFEGPPSFDGAFTYWTDAPNDVSGPWLVRLAPGCRQLFPAPGLPNKPYDAPDGDFAVLHGHVYYSDYVGVFELDPGRLHWTGRC
jgi:hypothetical protein